MKTDILIVGCGVAGLYCALNLPEDKKITVITKNEAPKSDSFLAQGGICVLRDEDDFQAFYEDTMKAGHYENNPQSVEIMIRSSQDVIGDLVSYGVNFEKDGKSFHYTREGAHSKPRILFHEDETGKEITSHLLETARSRANITLIENYTMVDLICDGNLCYGVIGHNADGVIAGLDVFKRVFTLLDESTEVTFTCKDGDRVRKGERLGVVRGDIRVLLSGERTALNFLQRMSGIATYTRKIADLLEGTKTKLLDTRKTTPNMRVFEKYAVKVGGGYNHRYNLSDGILLKDNHIGAAGGVKEAVQMAKEYAPFVRKIEIEVENLDMLREALEAGADIIMLDNMRVEDMREAVKLCAGKAETECSGNVTKENVAKLVDIGVDYISSGALTHSSPILDLSLKNLHAV